MPKPVKKATNKRAGPKRPSADPNLRVHQMMAEHMAKAKTPEPSSTPALSFQEQLSAHMAKLGAKGGKVSGAKRMEMPAKQRREIASKGARAMWVKRRREAKGKA